jgi:hypothetical protein
MIVGDRTDSTEPHLYTVTLDGEVQTVAVIADEEKGHVRRYKKNKLGILMKGRNGLITEDLYGVVKITRK